MKKAAIYSFFESYNIKSVAFFLILLAVAIALLPQLFNILNILMDEDYQTSTGSDQGGWVAVAIGIVIAVYGFIFKDEKDEYYPIYLFMAITATICLLVRQSASGIAERVAHYFSFGQMALVANATHNMQDKKMRAVVSMLILILCISVAIYKSTYSI